ncbi:hypothetical protein AaE_005344, partial [Aphanomyces astaci]
MLPEYVKDDPVGYHVSASRPGDGGGYTEGLVKAYNDQHGTVLVRFDDGEEAWYGPEDKLMFLQPSVASSPKHPPPDNPLQWKVRVASGKQGRVVGYSAPLAQILMDSGESVYVNIATHDIQFLYCTSIFQFESTPRHPETEHDPQPSTLPLFAKQFDVTDVRSKLSTYRLILEHCQSSPAWQTKIGSDLKAIENDHRRIHFVFQDLQATDRGLRLAAARCICALAYENELNQSILSTENGLTVEWLRVFSIPSKFQRLYDDQCKSEGRVPDQEDFIRFLTALVRSNMPTVAANVYKFCDKAAHVPRLWCYPPVAGSVNEWSTIPDPESHLIGFILTPRAALPKHLTRADIQDLTDLFTPDLSVMTLLKKAQVVQASLASPANRFALYEALKEDPLLELLLEDHPPLAGLLQTFEMEAAISWRDLFGYLSTRIHVDILTKTWGADLMPELLRLFVSLIPVPSPWLFHHSWVWQSQLRATLETSALLNGIHLFFEAFEDTESPVQLVMALTHLRRLEVPPAPKPSGTNPRRKASKGDHRISLAIVSAQEAVRALKAIQAKHHAESSFQKHL